MSDFDRWIDEMGDKWFDTIHDSIVWNGFKRHLLEYVEGKVLVDKSDLARMFEIFDESDIYDYYFWDGKSQKDDDYEKDIEIYEKIKKEVC